MANLRTGVSNPELVFKVTKDHFDTLTKGANLLLVANDAGLAGCVAFFKEPNPSALYGSIGIGLYALLFGLGFVFAVGDYGMTALLRMNALSVLIGDPNDLYCIWSQISSAKNSICRLRRT